MICITMETRKASRTIKKIFSCLWLAEHWSTGVASLIIFALKHFGMLTVATGDEQGARNESTVDSRNYSFYDHRVLLRHACPITISSASLKSKILLLTWLTLPSRTIVSFRMLFFSSALHVRQLRSCDLCECYKRWLSFPLNQHIK